MATAFKLKIQVATERQEHMALMQWAKLKPQIRDLLIHIPNEYDGGVVGGFNRKRMGVKRGVSDLMLPLPTKTYHGLFIELKRQVGSKVTIEQQWWVDRMNELGYLAKICYGFDDARKTIEEYLTT